MKLYFFSRLFRLMLCELLASSKNLHHCPDALLFTVHILTICSGRKFPFSCQKNIQPAGIITLSWDYTQTRTLCSLGDKHYHSTGRDIQVYTAARRLSQILTEIFKTFFFFFFFLVFQSDGAATFCYLSINLLSN